MREPLFLVLHLPGAGLVTADATAQHPGSRVDAVSFDAEAGFVVSSVSVVRGLPPESFKGMHRALIERYGPAPLLESDERQRRWVYSNKVADANILAKQLRFLARLRQDFGLWWNHISDGKYQLRAEIRDAEAAEESMGRIRAHYKLIGMEPQLSLQELPHGELAIRDELIALRKKHLET